MSQVILVNDQDVQVGSMDKLEAHQKGCLHRAFSIFIFNTKGEMLLQQRADTKYHSGGLWTNTCCSHPLPGEDTIVAAHRRLQEEMGFDTALTPAFQFVYRTAFDNGLIEYEYDHVFTGFSDALPEVDPTEVKRYRYALPAEIFSDILTHPALYTAWFKIAFPKMETYLATRVD